ERAVFVEGQIAEGVDGAAESELGGVAGTDQDFEDRDGASRQRARRRRVLGLRGHPRTLTVSGSVSFNRSAVPFGIRTSSPRVDIPPGVRAPPPIAPPISAPFLPPAIAPMSAPPAAGAPISSASFFFVAGAVRPIAVVSMR